MLDVAAKGRKGEEREDKGPPEQSMSSVLVLSRLLRSFSENVIFI